MNIHEYQAKEIFKKYSINVPNGEVIFSINEIDKNLKEKYCLPKEEIIYLCKK